MHFHLPKPLHGWREFSGEVGIIVIGVLIALGAQQVAENMHERRQAADAEARFRGELARNSVLEVERLAVGPCLTQRIGKLAQDLATGRTDWSGMVYPPRPGMPTALGDLYRKPSRNWVTEAYREATVNGDLDSLSAERRSQLASNYLQIDRLRDLNEAEQDLVTELSPLQFSPQLSPAERNRMIATLAKLDYDNGLIILVSRQTFQAANELGLAVPAGELFTKDTMGMTWPEELAGLRQRYGNCVDASALKQYNDIAIGGAQVP